MNSSPYNPVLSRIVLVRFKEWTILLRAKAAKKRIGVTKLMTIN